jgi:signal transduction histidine kinase
MFKSLASKFFIGFTLLFFTEAVFLSYIFGKSELSSIETHILEVISNRLETRAHEIENSEKVLFLSQDSVERDRLPNRFDRRDLLKIAPPSGLVVTGCHDTNGKPYYCGFSYVADKHGWVFDSVTQETLQETMMRRLKEILPFLGNLLLLALILTFGLSRFLLAPLKKFSEASQAIAEGKYEQIDLPLKRDDEVGALAQAFKKMIVDLREREINLQISGLKLAHSARLASIGQMGASIAHEVKNPLTSMMGYAKMLIKNSNQPETREAAEIILKEAERCNQILQQMLRFARNDPTESKPYPLKEVVLSVLLLLKAEARDRGIELKADKLIDTIVIGSAQQIQQVLINLVMNAFHASKSGSSVNIEMKEDATFACVLVTDQGSGIPKDIQSKIFDPFFTTKTNDGTGLGLSVAQEIVQQQGGTLQFESEEGHGCTFQIRLSLPS